MAGPLDTRLSDQIDTDNFPPDAEHAINADPTFYPQTELDDEGVRRPIPPPEPPPPTARPEGAPYQPEGAPQPSAPAQRAPAPPLTPQAPPVRVQTDDHPVLASLKRDLGIRPQDPENYKFRDVEVKGHVFRIVPRAWEDTMWALAKSRIQPDRMRGMMEFQTAVTAIGISAIDGVPVWEIFADRIPWKFDPKSFIHEDYPDKPIRHTIAEILLPMLRGDSDEMWLDPLVADLVYDEYQEAFGRPGDAMEGDGSANPTDPSTSMETANSES